MNPNYNEDTFTGKKIPLCSTMQAHTAHVWKNYVVNSNFKIHFMIKLEKLQLQIQE